MTFDPLDKIGKLADPQVLAGEIDWATMPPSPFDQVLEVERRQIPKGKVGVIDHETCSLIRVENEAGEDEILVMDSHQELKFYMENNHPDIRYIALPGAG